MDYPPNFPPKAQDRVEAAKVRAGRKFDRDKEAAARSAKEIRLLLVRYIMRIFRMFVREVKRLRLWHAAEMDSVCREFLRRLTIEAHSEKGYDHAGRPLSPMTSHVDGNILPGVLRAFSTWPAWRYFETALLVVGTSSAPPRVEAQPSPQREQPREEPARVSPPAAPGPTRESIQVTSSAQVYLAPWPARRAKKRKHKSVRPRVKEPVPAKPAVDKATTEMESANEAAPPITLEQPTKGRHANVESFKKRILAAEGYEPTNKDIRIVVDRSKDPRSFEYFQYNIAEASEPAIEVYDAVLKMEPTEFMRKLRHLKPESKPKRKSRR